MLLQKKNNILNFNSVHNNTVQRNHVWSITILSLLFRNKMAYNEILVEHNVSTLWLLKNMYFHCTYSIKTKSIIINSESGTCWKSQKCIPSENNQKSPSTKTNSFNKFVPHGGQEQVLSNMISTHTHTHTNTYHECKYLTLLEK